MTWETKLRIAANRDGVSLSAVECEMLLHYLESLKSPVPNELPLLR